MQNHKLRKFYYAVLSGIVRRPIYWKFNYSCDIVKGIEPPFIVLSNHVTNFDPIILGLSFKEYLYFVASEHVFRAGFLSRILKHVFAPISRTKGGVDASTVKEIFKRLRDGHSICIFAEGNRSHNGVTNAILPSTGKMIKSSRVTLVTYHLSGGYLTSPRWAGGLRRGKMHGELVNVYPRETLANMSSDEINAAIKQDLYENAFERQKKNPVRFKGKCLAETIETTLFFCPQCGALDSIASSGNTFYCKCCDMRVDYNEYGWFENGPYETILEWDNRQMAELLRLSETFSAETAAFENAGIHLKEVGVNHKENEVASGVLRMYRDRLECGNMTIPLSEMSDMAMHGRQTLVLSTVQGKHYEIISDNIYNARKYLELFKIYKNQRGSE